MDDFLALKKLYGARMRAFNKYLFECFPKCILGAKRFSNTTTKIKCAFAFAAI
jgi:hypothetical protein